MGAARRKLLPTVESVDPVDSPPADAEPEEPQPRRTNRHGVYVYCVVRSLAPPRVSPPPEPRLPDAGPPQVIALRPRTWLIVADVPLKTYGEQAMEQRLRNLEWVAACSLAHQAMVDARMRDTEAVVPMKVFTIFTTISRAKARMLQHAERLRTAMQRVAGCVEWGVRVTRAPQPARQLERELTQPWIAKEAAVADRKGSGAAGGSGAANVKAVGTAFLQSKVRERAAVRDAATALHEYIQALATTLTDVTRDVRYGNDPSQGTGVVPVLLNAAYLVPRRSESQFRAQVRIKSQPLLKRGCRVTVTGPWPPYSFVSPAGR